MDLNSLTAMGRSWVGNVCQKVEGVFHEMDSIMKQDTIKIANQEERTMSGLAKDHSRQDTRGFLSPKSCTGLEDRSILGIKNGPTHFERSHIDVHESIVKGTEMDGPHNFELLVVEPCDPMKENFVDKSNGSGAMNQLDSPTSSEKGEHQLEKVCPVNTIDHFNCETGEEAGASQFPENPLEGEEFEMDVGMRSVEDAINATGSADSGTTTSIPSGAKELFDSYELQSLNDSYEGACEVGSKDSPASLVHTMEAPIKLSYDGSDNGTLLAKCSESKYLTTGADRSSDPPFADTVDKSDELPRETSLARFYHTEEGDPSHSLLLSHALSNTANDSANVLYGREMETIDLSDEAEELEGNVDALSNKEICPLSLRIQNIRSLKKKLRDAFNRNKRIAKEYEHLGIWYGDIDLKVAKETQHPPPSTSIIPSKDQELSESEWVLL